MKVNFQIYDQGEDVLLAACDKEILGDTLEEEDIRLEVKESFYGKNQIELKRLESKFKRSTIANLVGEKVVRKAVEAGFGHEEDIMEIDGVPHLQIVRL